LSNTVKKIGIVIYNYYLGNALSLISCATSLAKEGYEVHIFIDSFIFERSRADFEEDNISVHAIDIKADPRVVTKSAASKRWNTFVTDKVAERYDKKQSRSRAVLLDVVSVLYRIFSAPQSLRYAFHAQALSVSSINSIKAFTLRGTQERKLLTLKSLHSLTMMLSVTNAGSKNF